MGNTAKVNILKELSGQRNKVPNPRSASKNNLPPAAQRIDQVNDSSARIHVERQLEVAAPAREIGENPPAEFQQMLAEGGLMPEPLGVNVGDDAGTGAIRQPVRPKVEPAEQEVQSEQSVPVDLTNVEIRMPIEGKYIDRESAVERVNELWQDLSLEAKGDVIVLLAEIREINAETLLDNFQYVESRLGQRNVSNEVFGFLGKLTQIDGKLLVSENNHKISQSRLNVNQSEPLEEVSYSSSGEDTPPINAPAFERSVFINTEGHGLKIADNTEIDRELPNRIANGEN